MECLNCGKDTAFQAITTQSIKVMKKEEYILIRDIPVMKCHSCHETLFDPQVAKQLDKIRKNPDLAAEEKVAHFPQVA